MNLFKGHVLHTIIATIATAMLAGGCVPAKSLPPEIHPPIEHEIPHPTPPTIELILPSPTPLPIPVATAASLTPTMGLLVDVITVEENDPKQINAFTMMVKTDTSHSAHLSLIAYRLQDGNIEKLTSSSPDGNRSGRSKIRSSEYTQTTFALEKPLALAKPGTYAIVIQVLEPSAPDVGVELLDREGSVGVADRVFSNVSGLKIFAPARKPSVTLEIAAFIPSRTFVDNVELINHHSVHFTVTEASADQVYYRDLELAGDEEFKVAMDHSNPVTVFVDLSVLDDSYFEENLLWYISNHDESKFISLGTMSPDNKILNRVVTAEELDNAGFTSDEALYIKRSY